MSKIKRIIIGVPARNEELTITESLNSIRQSILYSGRVEIVLVVCINGCKDRTLILAKSFQEKHQDIKCEIIQSGEGLVNAQREIVKKYPADVYIFPDADSTIDEKSIELLLLNLENDPECVVAYAKTITLENRHNKSIFQKIGFLYDSQKILTPRYYFHGRLFATKEWFFPENKEILDRAMRNSYTRELLKYSEKNIFLYADDIFMSSYILDKYGQRAIKQIEDAHCFSYTVGSFRDWLNTYRRRNIEMEKMCRWFPEYNYLWPLLNRKTDWQKWLKASLVDRLRWIVFLSMKMVFYVYLNIELLFVKFNSFKPRGQWQVTATTKNEIHQ